MSSKMLEVSQRLGGVTRHEPKWHFENGKYSSVPIEDLEEFDYCRDPDAILAFGEGIFPKKLRVGKQRPAHYVCDTEYDRLYLNLIPGPTKEESDLSWREVTLGVVKAVGLEGNLAAIEFANNYKEGLANVEPLKYRVQLDFFGRNSLMDKYVALRRTEKFIEGSPLALIIEGVDESKPDESSPDDSKATLYLMPPGARKQNMLNRPLSEICTAERIGTHEIRMPILGDTLTDFYAMLYGGWDAGVAGVVAGGSRLFKCIEEQTNFGGVDLQLLHKGLKPTSRKGFFLFDNPLMRGGWTKHGKERLIILGDRAYPGTVGAETMLAYLNDNKIYNKLDEEIKALAYG